MPKMPQTPTPQQIDDEQAFMRNLASGLDDVLNGPVKPKRIALVLLTAKFGEASGGRVNYIANCDRKDGQDLVIEFVQRIGRSGEQMGTHLDLVASGNTENAGIEKVALMLENKVKDYINEHGSYDGETGMTEFSEAGTEYLSELEELIEAVRALKVVKQ